MKIEKRTAGFTEEELEEQAAQLENSPEDAPDSGGDASPAAPAGRKRSVLTYIFIMFIAAFLLMAMSFAMHQRSNTEAMTQLQSSINTIQETQQTQEKIIETQDALRRTEAELADLKASSAQERAEQQQRLDAQQAQTDALLALYSLQQAYSARDYDACAAIIAQLDQDQDALAGLTVQEGVTPPAQRYLQLKEAVEAQRKD